MIVYHSSAPEEYGVIISFSKHHCLVKWNSGHSATTHKLKYIKPVTDLRIIAKAISEGLMENVS